MSCLCVSITKIPHEDITQHTDLIFIGLHFDILIQTMSKNNRIRRKNVFISSAATWLPPGLAGQLDVSQENMSRHDDCSSLKHVSHYFNLKLTFSKGPESCFDSEISNRSSTPQTLLTKMCSASRNWRVTAASLASKQH